MELKQFIKTALSDITGAVSELQSELENGAIINPDVPEYSQKITVDNTDRILERINFDIAVTVSEANSVEGQAKAGISIFSAKVGGKSADHNENVSRITFSIPVLLPCRPCNHPNYPECS